jgi:ABC-type transport system involved in multi-copper enzyme maturation permease subunit
MNALLAKEIRLILPAYITALLLAFVPHWFVPASVAGPLFAIGAILLGLSPFGREFGMNTFPLIMSQPLGRGRIWKTKISLAGVAMFTVFLVWCVACYSSYRHDWDPETRSNLWPEFMILGAVISMIAFAGGLWTTLLFRQISSAVWFCILIPAVLEMIVLACGGSDRTAVICLTVYSVGTFLWAQRYFFKIQETAWTGGEVNLTGWRSDAARRTARTPKPVLAFLLKELQLHQLNLIGIGLLLLSHFLVIFLRKAGQHTFNAMTESGLQVFGGLWLIVPLIVGSASIAEERKLGTMDAHLCLPLSRRGQFAGKLAVALAFGALLPSVLPWFPEALGLQIGAAADIGFVKAFFADPSVIARWFLICCGLTLAGFYGSSLSRGTVQALAIGLATAFLAFVLLKDAGTPESSLGVRLWHGPLIYYFLLPALIVIAFWLTWRNFAFATESRIIWRRNLLGWFCVLLFASALTAALFHRVWEFLGPLEPARGPARIAARNILLQSPRLPVFSAILPDGRLWVDKIFYEEGRRHLALDEDGGFRTGGRFVHLSGSRFLEGSNWVEAAATMRDVAAIKSDGTLWASEEPSLKFGRPSDIESETVPHVVRFGDESNWKTVVCAFYRTFVLLKRDGTLWQWGPINYSDKLVWPGVRAFAPVQIGKDSDWATFVGGPGTTYAWKSNGAAWNLTIPAEPATNQAVTGPILGTQRYPLLDNHQWLAFSDCVAWHHIGLREDGTLWIWKTEDPDPRTGRVYPVASPELVQIGKDNDWAMIGNQWNSLTALKKDGTLWRWPRFYPRNRFESPVVSAPKRIGSKSDWVGIAGLYGDTVSLAADGSLWLWWDREESNFTQPLLGPSRKPAFLQNIFAENQSGSH